MDCSISGARPVPGMSPGRKIYLRREEGSLYENPAFMGLHPLGLSSPGIAPPPGRCISRKEFAAFPEVPPLEDCSTDGIASLPTASSSPEIISVSENYLFQESSPSGDCSLSGTSSRIRIFSSPEIFPVEGFHPILAFRLFSRDFSLHTAEPLGNLFLSDLIRECNRIYPPSFHKLSTIGDFLINEREIAPIPHLIGLLDGYPHPI